MRILKFVLLAVCVICSGFLIADTPTKHDFEMIQVAEGIYAFIANESNSGAVQGNVVLVIGEKSALLIDSGQFPTLAETDGSKSSRSNSKTSTSIN